jgi:acetyl-CoA carboxylase beta subunit
VKDRITALAHDSLKRLHERVTICDDVDQLNDTAELAIKALGFGAPRPTPGAMVSIGSVNVVSREILAEARARMEGTRAIEHLIQAALPASIEQAERVLE